MQTGCFICPIYDKGKDFEYGLTMFESAIKNGINNNLYYIFSGYDQKEKFSRIAQERFEKLPLYLVMEENLANCKNPVSIKKYFGIKQLMNKYDFIAAIDCECVFVRNFDVGKLMAEIWNSKSMLASNISNRGARDVQLCCEALGLSTNEIVLSETNDFQYTWWFNEIPVYASENLREFFSWLNDERYKIIYNVWNCFDYLVYVLWLLTEKGYSLKKYKYKTTDGLIESLWKFEIFQKHRKEEELAVHWTSNININTLNTKICMQFHTDRRYSLLRRILSIVKGKIMKI